MPRNEGSTNHVEQSETHSTFKQHMSSSSAYTAYTCLHCIGVPTSDEPATDPVYFRYISLTDKIIQFGKGLSG